ncbi:MAG TPA: GGDEF domain-containing protein [Candidatus Cloacimonadota bacterium]|nr:GGDEF domain-containing protein [Candidatus Cloacimonadota bacterium]
MQHPRHNVDTVNLENFLPEEHERIRALLPELIHGNGESQQSLIRQITDFRMVSMIDACIVVADELASHFCELRSSHETQIMEYFSLLNHLPIVKKSEMERVLLQQMELDDVEPEAAGEQFHILQKHYVMLELANTYDERLCADISETKVNLDNIRLYILSQLNHGMLAVRKGDLRNVLEIYLSLISYCCFHEGPEAGLFVLVNLLGRLDWKDRFPHKKALLTKLSGYLNRKTCLSSAKVLFELFTMPEHYVPADEKFRIFRQIVKHPAEYMNEFQLQELYFFAGNYPAEVTSSFRESILFFQNSNYYLHKCWDRIRVISVFLRLNLDMETYFCLLPSIEERVYQLGCQISMQNNAYVETLHADYDKIEKLFKKVEELSLTDSLTSLRNRRYLKTNIYHMIHLANRHRVPISFAMIDIDHFKMVNDTYGHAAGDHVLKELSRLITKDFRKSDLIVRYGGEEFLMLLFDTRLEQSARILDEVRIAVSKHEFVFRGHKIPVTISIGLAESLPDTEHEIDIAERIREADKALYIAKETGRNRLVLAD